MENKDNQDAPKEDIKMAPQSQQQTEEDFKANGPVF